MTPEVIHPSEAPRRNRRITGDELDHSADSHRVNISQRLVKLRHKGCNPNSTDLVYRVPLSEQIHKFIDFNIPQNYVQGQPFPNWKSLQCPALRKLENEVTWTKFDNAMKCWQGNIPMKNADAKVLNSLVDR